MKAIKIKNQIFYYKVVWGEFVRAFWTEFYISPPRSSFWRSEKECEFSINGDIEAMSTEEIKIRVEREYEIYMRNNQKRVLDLDIES